MSALLDKPRASPPAERDGDAAALRAEIRRLRGEIEALRKEKAAIEAACNEDPVTALLNRRGFLRDLERALSFARRYDTPAALLLVDLDRFKPINDRYGHDAGDAALKHVAEQLQGNLRASDIVGRYGGDEFAILLWQVDGGKAEQKARSLEGILASAPYRWGDTRLTVGASIGAAAIKPDDTIPALLARADAAMYARKAERRGMDRNQAMMSGVSWSSR